MPDDDASPPSARPFPEAFYRQLAQYAVPHFVRPGRALEFQLHAFELSYQQTENPLWVWRAVQACHAADTPPPAWVMQHLAGVADKLWDLVQDPPADVQGAILQALQMKLSGPGSVFRRLNDAHIVDLASRMPWHIQGGHNETDAKYLVVQERKAKGEDVSESTVLRAWHKHRSLFE